MESQAAFDSAILFGVPRSPLLSLVQFRHANLNPYSQGPAYVVGNSYATTQVARYKTWGRVRVLIFSLIWTFPTWSTNSASNTLINLRETIFQYAFPMGFGEFGHGCRNGP